ncbi:MAG: metallophosphatase [Flavobacteriales bacterium]|nr:metallophosphatase [Flavobacteriales bacterium]
MNRKEFILRSGKYAAASWAMLNSGLLLSDARSSGDLTILFTNDWHSRIDPFPLDGSRNAGLGGAAKRAALIKEIRKVKEHVLLLDSGDIFQGTPYFNFFGGELEFKLMSQMKYDAATMGNHDFDAGLEGFARQLPHANFPFICSNYEFKNTILEGKTISYKIIRKGKYKIGIFGVGIELDGLVPQKQFGATQYIDPVSVANEMAYELKHKKNCNLIICLSHLGYRYTSDKISDVRLAENSVNIDLILGGHTHTFLNEEVLVDNKKGVPVRICQTGWGGINLGRIDYGLINGQGVVKRDFSMLKIC